ncbi:MAG: GNAT family N-acetyltransferase [Bacteroidota bacterium]|nr:GNAT family N-acetyltransferase [Bacteroidota bacterium]
MIKIRQAKFIETQTIVDFQLQMAKETEALELDPAIVQKGVESVFNNPGLGQYFVVIIDNQMVASLMITYEWSDWRNSVVWWIQSVFVQPGFRKQGLFRKMYHHIKNLSENDPNIAGLRLYVDLTNENARKVYTAIGMNGNHYQLFEDMKSQ